MVGRIRRAMCISVCRPGCTTGLLRPNESEWGDARSNDTVAPALRLADPIACGLNSALIHSGGLNTRSSQGKCCHAAEEALELSRHFGIRKEIATMHIYIILVGHKVGLIYRCLWFRPPMSTCRALQPDHPIQLVSCRTPLPLLSRFRPCLPSVDRRCAGPPNDARPAAAPASEYRLRHALHCDAPLACAA